MKPKVMEFAHDTELIEKVNSLTSQGIGVEKLYVMSYDNIRDKNVPDSVDESTFDAYVDNLGTLSEHTYRTKGEEISHQLEVLGFNETEKNEIENKLEEGNIILIQKE